MSDDRLTAQQLNSILETHRKLKRQTRQNEAVLFVPNPDDVRILYFLLEPGDMEIGKELNTPYIGEYIMEIDLGKSYPLSAPHFKLMTPNGRFRTDSTPCVAVYDIYGANYNPVAGVKGFVDYVVTAFVDDEYTKNIHGSHILHTKREEVERLAGKSREYNREKHLNLMELFDAERKTKNEMQAKMRAKMEAKTEDTPK